MSSLLSNIVLGSVIGAGSFGEVFLGTDQVHGDVAVKVLRQEAGETAAAWNARKEGLLNEAQRLKQATHPNVVQVYQLLATASGDAVHLVMEYCARGSLQAAYDAGPMCVAEVREIATGVALGLQALHARNMLHRDIKPGNILRDRRGCPKLGDFGLVTDDLILGYGSQAGYSDHISPEVWNGSGTSVRSDIWALGMTLFRLLHGAEWYSRSPQPRLLVQAGGFADTLDWLPHIPSEWRRFIRRMLQDDPHRRMQNATEVLNALARVPIEPNWRCSTSPSLISWEREAKGRRITANWQVVGARHHTWAARSDPLGLGQSRKLGSSGGSVSRTLVLRGLRDFLGG